MTLITKCPHCHTAFKVTIDQLNLYDGAVRCGICQQVFNGTEQLHQTESPASKETKETINKRFVHEEQNQAKSPFFNHDEEDEISISLTDENINALPKHEAIFQALEDELSTISLELEQVTGELFEEDLTASEEKEEEIIREPLTPIPKKHPAQTIATTQSRFTDLSLYPNLGEPAKNMVYSIAPHLDDVANISPSTYVETVEPEELKKEVLQKSQFSSASYHEIDNQINKNGDFSVTSTETREKEKVSINRDSSEPHFIRTAQKKQTGLFTNILLGLVTVSLLGTLCVQCLYMFSDRMIVWWPPSESFISKACDTFACPRRLETRIAALTIESSELQIIPELKNKYSLSLLIRNSSSSYQTWPHIELTLTDQEKKTIIRKIFAPANYLQNAEFILKGIPPYAEESVGLYLEMQTESNADYRISLFYP